MKRFIIALCLLSSVVSFGKSLNEQVLESAENIVETANETINNYSVIYEDIENVIQEIYVFEQEMDYNPHNSYQDWDGIIEKDLSDIKKENKSIEEDISKSKNNLMMASNGLLGELKRIDTYRQPLEKKLAETKANQNQLIKSVGDYATKKWCTEYLKHKDFTMTDILEKSGIDCDCISTVEEQAKHDWIFHDEKTASDFDGLVRIFDEYEEIAKTYDWVFSKRPITDPSQIPL